MLALTGHGPIKFRWDLKFFLGGEFLSLPLGFFDGLFLNGFGGIDDITILFHHDNFSDNGCCLVG